MINKWIGTGRVTKELELKYTGSGMAILNFAIAVERPFKNKQGDKETDFINIVAFNKTAENIANFFDKGNGIGIEGRIQTRNYENKQGERVFVTEVVADSFDFPIQNKKQGGNQQQSKPQNNQADNNPFANIAGENPFETNEEQEAISDSDLPF